MNTVLTSELRHIRATESELETSARRWGLGFAVSGTMALLSAIAGFACWLFGALPDSIAHQANLIGSGLIALTLILSFLMAHCMDRIDEVKKAIRLEKCRKTGYKDADCEDASAGVR